MGLSVESIPTLQSKDGRLSRAVRTLFLERVVGVKFSLF